MHFNLNGYEHSLHINDPLCAPGKKWPLVSQHSGHYKSVFSIL
ncbi:hypothetical protein [Rubritalea tangerina]